MDFRVTGTSLARVESYGHALDSPEIYPFPLTLDTAVYILHSFLDDNPTP